MGDQPTRYFVLSILHTFHSNLLIGLSDEPHLRSSTYHANSRSVLSIDQMHVFEHQNPLKIVGLAIARFLLRKILEGTMS